jgi:hypothetical protein
MSRSYIRAFYIYDEAKRIAEGTPAWSLRRKHSRSHRRASRPHRSCGLCHPEKLTHEKSHRDQRLTQDRIANEVERYYSDESYALQGRFAGCAGLSA